MTLNNSGNSNVESGLSLFTISFQVEQNGMAKRLRKERGRREKNDLDSLLAKQLIFREFWLYSHTHTHAHQKRLPKIFLALCCLQISFTYIILFDSYSNDEKEQLI